MSHIARTIGVILVAAFALTLLAVAVSTYTYRISCNGLIKAIGVDFFQDQQCTTSLTAIDWGLVGPGSTHYKTAYCKNTQNVPVTMVLATENFNPSAAEPYIEGAWNYTGQTLKPGQVIPVQFSLTIAANITGIESFSFVYVVTAVETTG